jgi:glycosyltransferase involved in cell wall biosynthesis
MSKGFELYEKYSCVKFDAIMTATPSIKNKFLKINKNSIDINNYPILGELANSGNWNIKQNEVSFVGWIAKIRGIEQMISALEFTNGIRLNLAGAFTNQTEEKAAKSIQAWSYVNELGFLDRKKISELLAKSCAGIVTFLPVPNHVDSQPNKMFEYMSAGIPIITSNFPLWKEIVEGSQCGICVDPLNPKLIGEAIQYIIDNPIEAEKMGKDLTNPYSSDKKKLPSEDISPLDKAPKSNLVDRVTEAVKGAGQRLKDNVMGTKEQNMKAEADEKRRAQANPEGNEAKFRKMMGKKDEFKSGGAVRSSASKRADGCAIRGKTKA